MRTPNLTFGFTPESVHLAFNPDTGVWMLTAGRSSGVDPQCEVYTSTDDGASFMLVASLSQTRIFRPAALGELWIAPVQFGTVGNVRNEVALSFDRGISWELTGHSPAASATPIGAVRGEGGFGIVTRAAFYWTSRIVRPALACT